MWLTHGESKKEQLTSGRDKNLLKTLSETCDVFKQTSWGANALGFHVSGVKVKTPCHHDAVQMTMGP